MLARMTACDGLPFKIFITSKDLRKSLTALGHSIPKSANVIRELVMQYGNQLRDKVCRNLAYHKSNGSKFSLTLDEWSSSQNRRYLNINIHGRGYFWNLGSIRIRGCFSAEICSNVISDKLINHSRQIYVLLNQFCELTLGERVNLLLILHHISESYYRFYILLVYHI